MVRQGSMHSLCASVLECPAPRVPHLLHLDLGGDRPSSAGQHRPKVCRPQPLLSAEPSQREHPPVVSLQLNLAQGPCQGPCEAPREGLQ